MKTSTLIVAILMALATFAYAPSASARTISLKCKGETIVEKFQDGSVRVTCTEGLKAKSQPDITDLPPGYARDSDYEWHSAPHGVSPCAQMYYCNNPQLEWYAPRQSWYSGVSPSRQMYRPGAYPRRGGGVSPDQQLYNSPTLPSTTSPSYGGGVPADRQMYGGPAPSGNTTGNRDRSSGVSAENQVYSEREQSRVRETGQQASRPSRSASDAYCRQIMPGSQLDDGSCRWHN